MAVNIPEALKGSVVQLPDGRVWVAARPQTAVEGLYDSWGEPVQPGLDPVFQRHLGFSPGPDGQNWVTKWQLPDSPVTDYLPGGQFSPVAGEYQGQQGYYLPAGADVWQDRPAPEEGFNLGNFLIKSAAGAMIGGGIASGISGLGAGAATNAQAAASIGGDAASWGYGAEGAGGSLWDSISNAASDIWTNVKELPGDIMDTLKGVVNEYAPDLSEAFSDTGEMFAESTATDATEGVAEGVFDEFAAEDIFSGANMGLTESATGVTTNPAQFLGGADVSEAALLGTSPAEIQAAAPGGFDANGLAIGGAGGSSADAAFAAAAGPAGVGAPSGAGLIDSVINWGKGAMDFAKANPLLATGIINQAGATLRGVGQSAQAENLARLKTDEQLRLQAETDAQKRANVQGSSYFGAKVPVRAPTTAVPLRRPDGSLVYAPGGGLISSAMGRR